MFSQDGTDCLIYCKVALGSADGVPKIGGAIPAVVKRGVVQFREITGEVHEAPGVGAMFQVK